MSFSLMAQALKIKTGSSTKKLILLKLCDNANDQGECWPSYNYIAEQCEVSRSTVIRTINELCESGLLKKEHRKTKDGNTSNLYLITIEGCHHDTTLVSPCHPPSVTMTPKPINKPISEPNIVSSDEQTKDIQNKKLASDDDRKRAFEYWWDKYPKHRRTEKNTTCWREWLKITKQMNKEQLTSLTNLISNKIEAEVNNNENGKYMPQTVKFLKSRKWLDGE